MTLLLALDSACASCSAALWRDDEILAHKFEAMPRGQSENLMPFVEEVMTKGGASFDQLDVLSVTVGPGAFTGIRICLSAARALALALKKPLVPVTTMEALFAAQDLSKFQGEAVAVVVETKRQDLYVQYFGRDGHALSEPEALLIPDLITKLKSFSQGKAVFLCGDGAIRLHPALEEEGMAFEVGNEQDQPDAGIFGAIALKKYAEQGDEAFSLPPAPIYLRPPDAIPPKPKFLFKAAGL